MLTRLTAKHLRRPTGLIGRYFGAAMNRLNLEMNRAAVEQLGVQSHHRVLDVGFGGGVSLSLLLERARSGQVHGIEISSTMLRRAGYRFSQQIADKQLQLTHADVTDMPFEDGFFDCVNTVNTLYFWPDVTRGLQEICRVLRPGGRFSLCYRPRYVMEKLRFTQHRFELYDLQDVNALLMANGFRTVRQYCAHDRHLGYACAVATKKELSHD